jgi:hypothetical protein
MGLLQKTAKYYRRYGLIYTAKTIWLYLARPVLNFRFQRFGRTLDGRSAASAFTEIYRNNLWGNPESKSGSGSTLAYTANLRAHLPTIYARFGIKTVLDAPCGDFNWMQHVPLSPDMQYLGGDIVAPLIERLTRNYQNAQRRFMVLDITTDALPAADLWICRDCLFHLSNADVVRALENFVRSDVKYLLTSTHAHQGDAVNRDIPTGSFRLIDLFAEPFAFPREVHDCVDDFLQPDPHRQMCLWDKAQVARALERMKGSSASKAATAAR